MWPRKQLDIDWSDLAFGLGELLVPRPMPATDDVVGLDWVPADQAVITLSVRTGLDLFLKANDFPAGSEIIVSGVTIPDMIRIVEHHGLVPVPIAVDADRLEPSLDDLERAITPRTRAILVAHLFGTRIDMEPVVRLARQHDLLVIEDCAQAFVGRDYAGHEDSDCSLFSFGPIKTATALGSAVVRVRDSGLRARMNELHAAYPIQTRRAFFSRLAKYSMFRVVGWPWVYGFIVRAYRLCGGDYDRALGNAAHSFPGAEFFQQIRRQPSVALVRLLQRRLATFDSAGLARLRRRTSRGNQLADLLPARMVVGGQNDTHTYWVMPIRVANAIEALPALQRAGFDATSRSSLIVVPSPDQPVNGQQPATAPWLSETIYLPNCHDIPDSEWTRLAIILGNVAHAVVEPTPASEPSDTIRVSVPS